MTDIPSFLREITPAHPPRLKAGRGNTFIDRGLLAFSSLVQRIYSQWDTSSGAGFMQRIDPRIKMSFLLFFIVSASMARGTMPLASILLLCLVLAAASRIGLREYISRVCFISLFFGTMISLPSSLNIITPGEIVVTLAQMDSPVRWWIYTVPPTIGITRSGLETVLLLTLRVGSSAAICLLILSTTPFQQIIRSLKYIRIPDTFIMVLTISYRYIFLFALTVEEFYLALKSRSMGHISGSQGRLITAGRIGHTFIASMRKSEQVYTAMRARGYTGNVPPSGFTPLKASQAAAIAGIAAAAVIIHFTGESTWLIFMN